MVFLTFDSPELIFLLVTLSSAKIFLTEEKVVIVWIEVCSVSLDFPHGNEAVHSRSQRTRVGKERVCVVFPPVNSVSQSPQFIVRVRLTAPGRRILQSGEPHPEARRDSSVSW